MMFFIGCPIARGHVMWYSSSDWQSTFKITIRLVSDLRSPLLRNEAVLCFWVKVTSKH